MDKKLKILIAQLNPIAGALKRNADLILKTYKMAAKKKIDLVAFPEMFLTGYQIQDLVLKPAFQKNVADFINFLAKECSGGSYLFLGAPIIRQKKVFNAYLVLNNGSVNIVSTKRNLPNLTIFDEHRYFHPGNDLNIISVAGFNIGCCICEDIWHPEVASELKRKGADLILCPNGSPYERDKINLRHKIVKKRVRETSLPVIYLNLIGGQDDQVFDGGSFIVNKNGRIDLQLPQFTEKKCVTEFSLKNNRRKFLPTEKEPLGSNLNQDYMAIVAGTRDYVKKSGFKKVRLGLSGGIDSALVATIAVDALGPKNVTCVRLPSKFSSEGSLRDSEYLVKKLGCNIDTISINESFKVINQALLPKFRNLKWDITEENLQSRIRGILLMALSNKFGDLVLTTGNKSEIAVGYSTIYGDMCGGYNPIKDVYKTRVYMLAKWRNGHHLPGMKGKCGRLIPDQILKKPASAELRPDQRDEDTLPPYEILDQILEGLIEKNMSIKEISKLGIGVKTIKRVELLIFNSEHKRFQSAPGVHLSPGSFWLGRRYPIVQNWRDPS